MYGVWGGGCYYVQMRPRHIRFSASTKALHNFWSPEFEAPARGWAIVSNMRGTREGGVRSTSGSAREVPGTNAILSIFHAFYRPTTTTTRATLYHLQTTPATERRSGVDNPPRRKGLLCASMHFPVRHVHIHAVNVHVGVTVQ